MRTEIELAIESAGASVGARSRSDLRWSDDLTPLRVDADDTDDDPDALHLEVIVPALNEQDRIGSTLDALAEQLTTMGRRAKVRVIDNGSSDRTADIVDSVSSEWTSVEITVEGCSKRGKGSAVARGILTSRARYVGFCDADLATPASAISDALTYLDEGWPVVIGSRHMAGAQRVVEQQFMRRLGGTGFRLMIKVLPTDLDLADTQCGFKFFRRDAAMDIFSRTEVDGFAFDVEVLSWARELSYPIREFPVEWTDQTGSSFSPVKHGVEVMRDLLKLRRSRRRHFASE